MWLKVLLVLAACFAVAPHDTSVALSHIAGGVVAMFDGLGLH
jgi:hypothetical protein